MGAIDPSTAFVKSRHIDRLHPECLQSHTRTNNVRNGIESTYLVEVNVLDRHSVNLALRFRDALEDSKGMFFHEWGEIAFFEHLSDFTMCASMHVFVLVVMMVIAALMGMPVRMLMMMPVRM